MSWIPFRLWVKKAQGQPLFYNFTTLMSATCVGQLCSPHTVTNIQMLEASKMGSQMDD